MPSFYIRLSVELANLRHELSRTIHGYPNCLSPTLFIQYWKDYVHIDVSAFISVFFVDWIHEIVGIYLYFITVAEFSWNGWIEENKILKRVTIYGLNHQFSGKGRKFARKIYHWIEFVSDYATCIEIEKCIVDDAPLQPKKKQSE